MPTYRRDSHLAARAADVYNWHARPGAFERLTPPWEHVRIESQSGGIETGARVVIRVGKPPLTIRWIAEHTDHRIGQMFEDVQRSGPFERWHHRHLFTPETTGSRLSDQVQYELPFGAIGRRVAGRMVHRKLDRMFRFRHDVTREDLNAHADWPPGHLSRVVLTGSSGLIGTALQAFLRTGGLEVLPLRRAPPISGGSSTWDQPEAIRAFAPDAVIHLAGKPLLGGRLNGHKKRAIRESRVGLTRDLCSLLRSLPRPPRVLLSASAVGIYGDRGGEPLAEHALPGTGFLADLCRDWEAAAQELADVGTRVVLLRIGVVLSPRGGALKAMLPTASLGLGGPLGSGRQFVPWISIDDCVYAIHRAMMDSAICGPVNICSPEPATSAELARALGRVLRRPAMLPVPAAALRLRFGALADAALLSSTRALPEALRSRGFRFRHATLDEALRHLLGRHPVH